MIIISFDIGIKNLSYCVFNKKDCCILEWNNVSIIPEKNKVKSYTIEKILKLLFENLDRLDLFRYDITSVFIENQPTKNPKMKNIQIGTFSYFIMKGGDINVKLVSSKKKLHFNEVNDIDPSLYVSKQKYTERKKIAVLLCKNFIEKYQFYNMKNFFLSSKKKDDLADAFLYCMHDFLSDV
jgi:hypothetical protein